MVNFEEQTNIGAFAALADPWDERALDFEWRDNWLLGYVDILTIFMTLLVVLLALSKQMTVPVDQQEPEPATSLVQDRVPTQSALQEGQQVEQAMLSVLDAEVFLGGDEVVSPTQTPSTVNLLELNQPEFNRASLEHQESDQAEIQPQPGLSQNSHPVETMPKIKTSPSVFEQMVEELAAEGLDKRIKIKQVAQGALLELQDNILFPLGSAELKQGGFDVLEDLLQVLVDHGGRVSVEGHSDNMPIFSDLYPSNWELSSARATQVARYLIEGGYEPAKLRVIGYADTQPLASNKTAEGRAQNRRVALVVELSEEN